MSDIFLSSVRTDRQRVAPIVALLESCGWSVWWAPDADTGGTLSAKASRELDHAGCMVAAWSIDSVDSSRVRAQAREGLDKGVLVSVHLDVSRPPAEFAPAISLAGWIGDASSPRAQELIAAVGALLEPADTELQESRPAFVRDNGLQAPPGEDDGFSLPRTLTIRHAQRDHWEPIRDDSDPARFEATLARHPGGDWAQEAQDLPEQLRRAPPQARYGRSLGLGLLASLTVAVPVALWLSGWIGGAQVAETASVSDVGPAAGKPGSAPPARDETPTTAPRPASFAIEDLLAQVTPRVEDLLTQARRLVARGDILGAREVLGVPETATSGPLMFMLAETYDPRMLASWKSPGGMANRETARTLYRKARDLGDGRAQQRLDALKSS